MTVDAGERTFVASPDVVVRRIAGETLLVPVSSRVGDLDAIYTLSDVASRVWELLASPVSSRQMVDAVCAEYEVGRDVAARDVAGLVDELVGKKLIRPAGDAEGGA